MHGDIELLLDVVFSIFLVYAVRRLDLSAGEIGLIFTLGGLGGLAGALVSQRLSNRFGVGPTTLAMTLLFAPAAFFAPLAPKEFPHPFLVAGFALYGFAVVVYNITQVSLRQAITPERIQGRMNSVMRFLVWGTIPLGSLTGGALASTIGLRETLFVGAAGEALAVLPILFSAQRKLEQFPEPEEAPAPVDAAAAAGIIAVPPAPVRPDA